MRAVSLNASCRQMRESLQPIVGRQSIEGLHPSILETTHVVSDTVSRLVAGLTVSPFDKSYAGSDLSCPILHDELVILRGEI